MTDKTLSKDAIVIERTFDAPIDLIWQMWAEPEHFKQWYGPQGFTVPVAQMDFRLGGKRLFCMASPDGSMKMWLTGEYTDITPKERLVYTESMADENGNILPNGDQNPVTTITVLLEDLGGRTKMRMTHAGIGVNEQGASEGWEKAIDKMANHIEAVLNKK
jgi:uncharacterized protein YndB with AHSA1/START domain